MAYVDGFVLPVKRDQLELYQRIAQAASAVWRDHGALQYWECVGDDLDHPDMGSRSFLEMAGVAEDEVVLFSWAVFASREERDAANQKICADPRMAEMMEAQKPPFDVHRMAFAGFKPLVESS